MQTLARGGHSAEEVRSLLQARVREVRYGLDLLDLSDQVNGAVRVSECTVTRTMYASVHGAVDFVTPDTLDWDNSRVRPWQEVNGVRFDMGVFSMDRPVSTTEGTNKIHGRDKLAWLQRSIGDTYWLDTGAAYLASVRQAITDSGHTGASPLIDSSAEESLLAAPLVWALNVEETASYLRVVNDLLSVKNYRGLWADEDGHFRSAPYVPPDQRPVEWDFDLSNPLTNIVGPSRTLSTDRGSSITAWRFVRSGMNTKPMEGAGIYTVGPWSDSAASRAVYSFDASDQASLVSQGARQVNTDSSKVTLLELVTASLPCLGHFDTVSITDPRLGIKSRGQIRRWEQPLHSDQVSMTAEVLSG